MTEYTSIWTDGEFHLVCFNECDYVLFVGCDDILRNDLREFLKDTPLILDTLTTTQFLSMCVALKEFLDE